MRKFILAAVFFAAFFNEGCAMTDKDKGKKESIDLPPVKKDTDEYGWSPLAAALDNSDFVLAKSLLKDKNPGFRNTPLIVYFSDGLSNSYDIVSFLIKNGINKDSYSQAFINSIRNNDLKTAKLLLDSSADINATDVDYSMDENLNALFFTNDYETAKFLISKGIKTDDKRLPEYALTHFNLLQALDENGVKIPISPKQAEEGLFHAAQIGNALTVKFFLSKGANVNYKLVAASKNIPEYSGGKTALIINALAGYDNVSYDENNMVSPEIAKILIKAGADLNAKDDDGKTALHYAAGGRHYFVWIGPIPLGNRRDRERGFHGDPAGPPAQNHEAIAKVLIDAGAALNEKDNDGNTPLLLSAKERNFVAMKMLLQAGADRDVKNNEEKTFFDYLDTKEGLNIVKDANLFSKVPQESLNNSFIKIIDNYLEKYSYDKNELAQIIVMGADINTQVDGKNALIYFLDRQRNRNIPGIYDFFKQLIDSGINVNAKDREGMEALAFAVYQRADTDIIKLLTDNGADINAIDNSHINALAIANVSGYKEASEILKKAGAKRDVIAEWWYTLHSCWSRFDITMFKALMDEGVNINVKTTYAVHPNSSWGFEGNGMTVLMFLAKKANDKSNEFIKEFIKLGADINLQDNDGCTALHYLARTRMYESDYKSSKRITDFYNIFKQAGGDVNIKDKNGKTAYDYAVVTLPPLADAIKNDQVKTEKEAK